MSKMSNLCLTRYSSPPVFAPFRRRNYRRVNESRWRSVAVPVAALGNRVVPRGKGVKL